MKNTEKFGGIESKSSTALRDDYYVYFLLDPRKEYLPFYIGKGCGNRAVTHLYKRSTDNIFKTNTIAAIRKAGFEPVVFFWQKNLTNAESKTIEEEQISRFGRRGIDTDGILTNRIIVNHPPIFSGKDHWTAKVDIHPRLGSKHSDETKRLIGEKNSVHMKGNVPWNKGRTDLPSSWNAGTVGIMKSNSGSWTKGQTPHNKGKPMSEKQKQKLREAWVRRKSRLNDTLDPKPL